MCGIFNLYHLLSNCLFTFLFSKVKVQPRTGHEGPEEEWRNSSTLSLSLALDGDGWSMPRPDHFTTQEIDPKLIVQKARWDPPPIWTVAENLAPTEIESPDHPAIGESQYRLSYPGFFFSVLYFSGEEDAGNWMSHFRGTMCSKFSSKIFHHHKYVEDLHMVYS